MAVFLVGAGPGDPELITLKGVRALEAADVIVYDGLANSQLLHHARPGAERIYAGKKHSADGAPLSQDEINELLVRHGRAGRTVVRLKGGDPFVFGRGGEEAQVLADAGIPFEVVPGVTAATAVPAYAGIPLTLRDAAATVVCLTTGSAAEGTEAFANVQWPAVAAADTIVLFMAVTTFGDCARRLVAAGRDADTPAAAIRWGTTASQETVTGTLGTLEGVMLAARLKPPALIVIGDVVRCRDSLAWYERRPLFGARVLLTRMPHRAQAFAHAILGLGGEPVVAPVTELEALPPAPLARALAGGARWIVLTSQAAVEPLMLAARDSRALAGIRIAAVGRATADALYRRAGIAADLVPERATGADLATALLAHDPDLQAGRVLVPRQADGREELPDALRAAGVTVDVIDAYRSRPLGIELLPIVERLRAGDMGAVVFFAPSQVDALCLAIGSDAADVLGGVRVICAIGPTTAAALTTRGIRVDIMPATTAPAAIAHALAAVFRKDPA